MQLTELARAKVEDVRLANDSANLRIISEHAKQIEQSWFLWNQGQTF